MMKFFVKLFTNSTEWESQNDIQEVVAKGYMPRALSSKDQFLSGKSVSFGFREAAKVYGCYVVAEDGELAWHQRFDSGPFVIPTDGGTIIVDISPNS